MQSHTQLLEAETGSLKAWTPGVLRPILGLAVVETGSNPLRMD